MNAVFESREQEIQAAIKAFPCLPGQKGLLVSIQGRIAGCDTLSSSDAYEKLHGKLVRSYVLDTLLEPSRESAVVEESHVQSFLQGIIRCKEERFSSVGCGESLRFENGEIAGAALVYDTTVVHLTAFRSEPGENRVEKAHRMATLSARRRRFFNGSGSNF